MFKTRGHTKNPMATMHSARTGPITQIGAMPAASAHAVSSLRTTPPTAATAVMPPPILSAVPVPPVRVGAAGARCPVIAYSDAHVLDPTMPSTCSPSRR